MPLTVKALWETLVVKSGQSSVSGLNNAAKARSPVKEHQDRYHRESMLLNTRLTLQIRSAVWLAIFTVLIGLTIRGIWKTIVDFTGNPYLTSTDLSFEPLVVFPAITVCNHNR